MMTRTGFPRTEGAEAWSPGVAIARSHCQPGLRMSGNHLLRGLALQALAAPPASAHVF